MRCPECELAQPDNKEERCQICGHQLALDAKDLLKGPRRIVREERKAQIDMAGTVEVAIAASAHAVVEAQVGCHAAGQGILLFDGSVKAVENVVVGDALVGPDGTPRYVTALARGQDEMVDIVPVKGAPWRVNVHHILTLKHSVANGATIDVCVKDFLKWAPGLQRDHKLIRAAAEFYPSKIPLDVPPYFLGVLLGDGSLSNARGSIGVTTADPEIVAEIEKVAAAYGMQVTQQGSLLYNLVRPNALRGNSKKSPLSAALHRLGLRPVTCADRFVPDTYKTASRQVRREVLAGLLDTDGHLTCNCYDFVSKSERLANDVAFLARTTGLAAYITACTKSAHKAHTGNYFRVSISGDTELIPCRIKRKQAAPRKMYKNALHTGFSVVRTHRKEDYYGFSLTGDGRYLLDDCTVTHNTGKSLAYTIPAILSKKRTVISTATHTLQAQLVEKDLPFLKEKLAAHDINFTFAIAKGKENFVCGAAVKAITELPTPPFELNPGFVAWANDALLGAHTGDKVLLGENIPAEWGVLNAANCYKSCRFVTSCGYHRVVAQLRTADIVVANHSMVGYDAALTTKVVKNPIFGPYDVLVLDEAHNAARYIREALSHNAHENLPNFARTLLEKQNIRVNPLTLDELKFQTKAFFGALVAPSIDRPTSVLPSHREKTAPAAKKLIDKVDDFLAPHKKLVTTVENNLKSGSVLLAKEEMKYRACKEVVRRFEDFKLAVSQPQEELEHLVSYVRVHHGGRELVSTPLKVGPYLKAILYPGLQSVIATSATIAVNGHFAQVKDELGLTVKTKELELRLKSPFNLEKNAIFYVSRALTMDPPSPDDTVRMQQYATQVAYEITRLAKVTGGRAFVLFTSSKELEAVYAQLLRAGLNLKKQDAINRADYLQAWFREESRLKRKPVLLGLKSFWEGVSIEGDDLSLVIIVKLPFPQQDPIYEALCKKSTDPFNEVTFPLMVRELQQGTGRLIRTMTDRGIVAILDRRLTTKPYSGKVFNSLPFGRPLLNIGEVENRYKELVK